MLPPFIFRVDEITVPATTLWKESNGHFMPPSPGSGNYFHSELSKYFRYKPNGTVQELLIDEILSYGQLERYGCATVFTLGQSCPQLVAVNYDVTSSQTSPERLYGWTPLGFKHDSKANGLTFSYLQINIEQCQLAAPTNSRWLTDLLPVPYHYGGQDTVPEGTKSTELTGSIMLILALVVLSRPKGDMQAALGNLRWGRWIPRTGPDGSTYSCCVL